MSYTPLTKKIITDDGTEMVVCRFCGTDKCRKIHSSQQCVSCPMLSTMLIQLNAFEEIYAEVNNETEV